MTDKEPARRAAHILLDTASVWSPSDTDDEQSRLLQLAMNGIKEIGCVTAMYDDETDESEVDISQLAGGLMVLVSALVDRIASETGLSRVEVVAQTREVVDRRFEES